MLAETRRARLAECVDTMVTSTVLQGTKRGLDAIPPGPLLWAVIPANPLLVHLNYLLDGFVCEPEHNVALRTPVVSALRMFCGPARLHQFPRNIRSARGRKRPHPVRLGRITAYAVSGHTLHLSPPVTSS